MKLSNEIVLRPRFSLQFNRDSRHLKSLFEDAKQGQSDFKISCVDDHIFVKLPKKMVEHLNTEEYMMSNEELGGKTVRLVTAWNTKSSEVDEFLKTISN